MVEIRLLSVADLDLFWPVRLRALAAHPESFGTAVEEERELPMATVRDRFRNDWTADGGFLLGAFVGRDLAGTIGVRRRPGRKRRHAAEIWAVWVDPGARGRGIGRALLVEAVRRAREAPDLAQLELSVGLHNGAARRLYAGVGFRPYGVARQALRVGDRFIDEELMVLFLND